MALPVSHTPFLTQIISVVSGNTSRQGRHALPLITFSQPEKGYAVERYGGCRGCIPYENSYILLRKKNLPGVGSWCKGGDAQREHGYDNRKEARGVRRARLAGREDDETFGTSFVFTNTPMIQIRLES